MKPVFPDFDKPVTRKVGAFWILAQLPFILSACNGEPPGSKHSLEDKYQINAQTTEVAINSEGENLFKLRCGTCHSATTGQPSVIGPPLVDVFSRSAGSVEGFAYSKAIRAYGKKWTPESLDKFLETPAELIPGNRMVFGGMSNAEQRKLIIEYLEIPR